MKKKTTKIMSVLLALLIMMPFISMNLGYKASAASNNTWYVVHSSGTETYGAPAAGDYYITDGNGHALNLNGTSINSIALENASTWNLSVYSSANGTYYIKSGSNYLRQNNGALSTSTSTGSSRRFTIKATSANTVTIQASNGNYLYYTGSGWGLGSTPYDLTLYTSLGGYIYTIDTDGVDANAKYLITGNNSNYALILDGTAISSIAVTKSDDKKTIVMDNDTSDWVFSGSSSGTIKWDASNRWLRTNSTSIGTVTSSAGNFTIKRITSQNPVAYQLYFNRNSANRYLYVNDSGTFSYNTSTSSYVWLYKYTEKKDAEVYTNPTTSTVIPDKWAMMDGGCVAHINIGEDDILLNAIKDALSQEASGTPHIYTSDRDPQVSAEPMTIMASNPNFSHITFDTSNVDTSTAGDYNVPVKYDDIEIGRITVNVMAEKPIANVEVVNAEGSVYVKSDETAETSAFVRVTYTDGTYSLKPVTLSMLQGSYDVNTIGEYQNLTVVYKGHTCNDAFRLRVIDLEQYPEYPEEGSVRINKTGTAPQFSDDGIAKIELTATGVPMQPGIDIVFVLDTSSSMGSNMGTYNGKEVYCEGTSSTSRWFYTDGINAGITNNSNSSVQNKISRHDALQNSLDEVINSLKEEGVDGVKRDIQVAICDFNGYTHIDKTNDKLASVSMISTSTTDNSKVYTGSGKLNADAFVDISTLINNVPTLQSKSGTNYDRAMEEAYTLIKAKKEYNESIDDDREQYVIFMSDGGSFQYNYIVGNSSGSGDHNEWNDWLLGTWNNYTDVPFATNCSHKYFYNGSGNKHRMAAAISGAPNDMYAIINPNNTTGSIDVTGDGKIDPYMENVAGLGATMYSIGFCICTDVDLQRETIDANIKKMASDEKYYYEAKSATALDDAFNSIIGTFKNAGTEAYFVDTMGTAYDIQMASTYMKNGRQYTLSPAPTISVNSYTLYTEKDYSNGIITDRDDIGVRTGAHKELETVTFNAAGTEAYSNMLGSQNILIDGVIYAKTFTYNSNSYFVEIPTEFGESTSYTLPGESFYWKIGIVAETEYVLSYYEYLTGSMEGTRAAGTYPTNDSAILYYKNYQGYLSEKATVSPRLPWKAAAVSYEFYLVNSDGLPVNNQGTVVPFSNRVLIGNTQTKEVLLNNKENTSAAVVARDEIPEGYTLYSPNAEYLVSIDSGTTPSYATITDNVKIKGQNTVTTYFYDSKGNYHQAGTIPDNKVSDYANTHVAFAILLIPSVCPDEIVIDYGLPVQISALANDLNIAAGTAINNISTSIPAGTKLNTEGYDNSLFTQKLNKVTLPHGTAEIDGNTIIYRATDSLMSKEDVVYYEVVIAGKYYYTTVTIYPAQNMYYEDDFFKFSPESEWKTAGIREDKFQSEDRPGTFNLSKVDFNNVYGYDPAYDSDAITYSLGSARYVTVNANTPTAGKNLPIADNVPVSEFSFTGTGFDLFSVTAGDTGYLNLWIYNSAGTRVSNMSVQTYYGYTFDESENKFVVSDTANDALYQIPVIRARDLAYDTYTVYFIPWYNSHKMFDVRQAGEFKIYIDGIRIYDPAGPEPSEKIQKVYESDNEACVQYVELRKNIISANDFYKLQTTPDILGEVQNYAPGCMYIDGINSVEGNVTEEAYKKYLNDGPNNELYLAKGQSVAFYFQLDECYTMPKTIQLGMKVVDGDDGVATALIMNSAQKAPYGIDVAGGSPRYYDITDSFAWNEDLINNTSRTGFIVESSDINIKSNPNDYSDMFWNFTPKGNGYEEFAIGFNGQNITLTQTEDDIIGQYAPNGTGDEFTLTGDDGLFSIKNTKNMYLNYDGVINGASEANTSFYIYKVDGNKFTQVKSFEDIANSDASANYVLICQMNEEQRYVMTHTATTIEKNAGTYKTAYPVVITNTSNCILSLTNIKVTFNKVNGPVSAPKLLSNMNTYNFASTVNKSINNGTLTPMSEISNNDDISMEWVTTDLDEGAEAKLYIRTPANITSVMVGDTELTDCTINEDGSKTWTYQFTVTEDSADFYNVVITDDKGNVQGMLSTEGLNVTRDSDEEKPDSPDDIEPNFIERLNAVFETIINFFRSIIKFLTENLFAF